MNKIIRENYPASKLPEDLREGLDTVKLPDAIQLATAEQNSCEVIISGDKRLEPVRPSRRVPLLIDELTGLAYA